MCVWLQLGYSWGLPYLHHPLPPHHHPPRFCCCACASGLETAPSPSRSPARLSSREKGLSTQVQVPMSPLEDALLLHQPPAMRCPMPCLSFFGGTPPGAPRFPARDELSGRRDAFSQSRHLSNRHPAWVTCALYPPRAGWLRFCDRHVSRPLLGKHGRLNTCTLPPSGLCQRPILPHTLSAGKKPVSGFFVEKVRTSPFSLLRLRAIPLNLVPPSAHLPLPCGLPEPGVSRVSTVRPRGSAGLLGAQRAHRMGSALKGEHTKP